MPIRLVKQTFIVCMNPLHSRDTPLNIKSTKGYANLYFQYLSLEGVTEGGKNSKLFSLTTQMLNGQNRPWNLSSDGTCFSVQTTLTDGAWDVRNISSWCVVSLHLPTRFQVNIPELMVFIKITKNWYYTNFKKQEWWHVHAWWLIWI